MNQPQALGIVAVGLAGVSAGIALARLPAIVLTAVVALAIVAALEVWERRRIRRLTAQLNAWLGTGSGVPVAIQGSAAWRELTVTLNALCASHARRGARLDQERPWRWELVDSLVQAALLFDRDARLQAANEAARELLSIPIDIGEATVLQAVGSPAIADAVREARRYGNPVRIDVEHNDRDLRVTVSMVGDETLVIITDRTRERRVEELRRNFVVNASHELKTPVTSIQTLAEALAVTVRDDPDRTATLVSRLGIEAQRLARLLHDLLDLRRLEERGPLERVPVDLAELVRLTIAELIPRAEELEITVDLDAPDHAVIAGVPGDVEVILKNLVGNAVQYNQPGGSVSVSIESRRGQQVLTVSDSGIGIPQQDLARIFERFYRVDTARSRETGGTGLGLSIVRHAIERHGGSIRVESLLGEGTTFTVTLPVEPPR
ncbi:MAG: ATP-binding protein [Nitriliruptoraceae bacterium]